MYSELSLGPCQRLNYVIKNVTVVYTGKLVGPRFRQMVRKIQDW